MLFVIKMKALLHLVFLLQLFFLQNMELQVKNKFHLQIMDQFGQLQY